MPSAPQQRSAFAAFRAEACATLLLAIPLMIGQLCSMGQGVVEMMLAGHLDAHALGAVAIGANVFSMPLMAANGLMMAVPPVVAQSIGAHSDGRRKGAAAAEIGGVFAQAIWLALGLGGALGLATWFAGGAVLALVGVPAGLAADAAAYLRAASLGMPAIALYFATRGIATGQSRSRLAMLFALLGLLLLVPVGRVLAYGGLGIPALGAVGCGLAGAIVNAVQAVAFLAWMRRDLGRLVRPDPRILLRLLRLGLPMAGGVMLEVGAFTFASLAMGRFGEIAAASHQVALNVASVTFMLPLGLSMAMTVRVGLAFGRRDRAAMRRAGLAGLAIVLATQTVSSCLMIGLPRAIAALYTPDPRVIAGAAALLVLAGVFQFSDGIQVAAAGALRGLQDVRAPVAICLVAYWGIGIPAGLALAFAAGWRVPGMWVGLICGLTAAAALLSARFLRLTRPAHADVAARLAA